MKRSGRAAALASVLAAAFVLQACEPAHAPPGGTSSDMPAAGQSEEALRKFLDIREPITRTAFELVTLPEPSRGVPGPTDYLVLVASVDMAAEDRSLLLARLPRYAGSLNLQGVFARPWMAPSQKSVFGPDAAKSVQEAYDATPLLRREAKRALLVPTPAGMLVYVEYVSP